MFWEHILGKTADSFITLGQDSLLISFPRPSDRNLQSKVKVNVFQGRQH